ncbi:hypothetical protein PCE1_000813 [Barthelona sp. PCE]
MSEGGNIENLETMGAVEEEITPEEVIKSCIHHARCVNGARAGLRSVVKALDAQIARVCFLASDCGVPEYVALVTGLAKQNNIALDRTLTAENLGLFMGFAKYDAASQKARKVVSTSSVVITDFGRLPAENRELLTEVVGDAIEF